MVLLGADVWCWFVVVVAADWWCSGLLVGGGVVCLVCWNVGRQVGR